MKLSYNWLNEFVDLSGINLKELAEKLTMSAFEVEEIEESKKILPDTIVLGKIEKLETHPNADKLQITQTSLGFQDNEKRILQIVCGAKNIKEGNLVPVALVGSTVTNRHDGSEFVIKKSKIRGVESMGMLCSADELGFTEEEVNAIKEKWGDGIYILDEVAKDEKPGTPISKVLKQEIDYVLEVGARSNRGDALSVMGQARELSAILDKDLKLPEVDMELRSNLYDHDKSIKTLKPKITTTDDCSLFFTLAIEGIEIKESPQWLKDRINAMGTKSINNIVDISNYVLLELGQPMHFYDREKLSGDTLNVRRATVGEKLMTLEDKEAELDDVNLVIADKSGPVSLAGVMGGKNCSINDETENIVIEVAVFTPATVRKSSRKAGIESESKRRYERGVDRANSRYALFRAVELIAELASPQDKKIKVGEINIAGSDKVEEKNIELRLGQIKRLLGIEMDAKTAEQLLSKLGFKKIKANDGSLEFSIPSFRQNDITREIDLIEEIGRLYGFDQIPAQNPSTLISSEAFKEVQENRKTKSMIRKAFTAAGFSEVQLSSLIGDSLVQLNNNSRQFLAAHINPKNLEEQHIIEMDNPLSIEHRLLRQSISPALIQAASRNYAYDKTVDIKLFELGKIYYSKEKRVKLDSTREINRIGAILIKLETDWTQAKPKTLAENFFYFKSIIQNLYPRAKFKSIDKEACSKLHLVHPGISAIVEQDRKIIGFIAKLHPTLNKDWDLPDESYVLELDFPRLNSSKFKPIASTPIIERDITVDSDNILDAQSIIDFITKNTSKELQNIKLVSLYKRKLEEGDDPLTAKSSSFRLKWQSVSETLSGEAIDQEVAVLKNLMESQLRVKFR